MDWSDAVITALVAKDSWAYHENGPCANEPAAMTALALMAHGHVADAEPALRWLAKQQTADGSIGITGDQTTPGWPTAQTVLAWTSAKQAPAYQQAIDRAVQWLFTIAGTSLKANEQIGHDSTLIGWPWVDGTHSWCEPTSWSVLALKAAGHGDHPRTREGVRVLVDRLLPEGGCNYGNTYVLGQPLRPHLQPTGICLMALAGEETNDPRIERSINYLERELSARTASASLSYGLLGLTALGSRPPQADAWLAAAAARTLARDKAAYRLALLALAAIEDRCPLTATASTLGSSAA